MRKLTLLGFAGLLTALAITGCSRLVWVKPGATQLDHDQDKYACRREAQKEVTTRRVDAVVKSPGHGGGGDGAVVQKKAVYGKRERVEVRRETDWSLFGDCMRARGWRQVREPR
ncbi:MAG: hypothetical protein ACE5G5_03540 [Candidatus Methylomirabilales bacterium]